MDKDFFAFAQTLDMGADLWALFTAIAFGMIHLGLSSILSLAQLGPHYILSARDQQRDPSGFAGRIARAYRNYLENFAQFAAAIALVNFADANGAYTDIGAWTFVIARILYVPAYAIGAPGIRPMCWSIANFGVVIILADLFF